MSINVFAEHSSDVTDPRQSAKVIYPLYDVLFLSICGVITGCEGWEYIEDFGHSRLNWLQGLGLFREGLPFHDTIARIIVNTNLKCPDFTRFKCPHIAKLICPVFNSGNRLRSV